MLLDRVVTSPVFKTDKKRLVKNVSQNNLSLLLHNNKIQETWEIFAVRYETKVR